MLPAQKRMPEEIALSVHSDWKEHHLVADTEGLPQEGRFWSLSFLLNSLNIAKTDQCGVGKHPGIFILFHFHLLFKTKLFLAIRSPPSYATTQHRSIICIHSLPHKTPNNCKAIQASFQMTRLWLVLRWRGIRRERLPLGLPCRFSALSPHKLWSNSLTDS